MPKFAFFGDKISLSENGHNLGLLVSTKESYVHIVLNFVLFLYCTYVISLGHR